MGGREEGNEGEREDKETVKWIWEKERERDKEREKKERKAQGEGVMEEQMNRDLITRPLCPESVG